MHNRCMQSSFQLIYRCFFYFFRRLKLFKCKKYVCLKFENHYANTTFNFINQLDSWKNIITFFFLSTIIYIHFFSRECASHPYNNLNNVYIDVG